MHLNHQPIVQSPSSCDKISTVTGQTDMEKGTRKQLALERTTGAEDKKVGGHEQLPRLGDTCKLLEVIEVPLESPGYSQRPAAPCDCQTCSDKKPLVKDAGSWL